MTRISNTDAAKQTLVHYFQTLAVCSGMKFSDNDKANIEFAVEQIIAAAADEGASTAIRRIRTDPSWIEQ